MKTPKTLKDLLSKQQEMLDSWTKSTKSSIEDQMSIFIDPIKKTSEMYANNLKLQESLIKGNGISEDSSQNFANGTMYFQNWIALQNDFTEKWLDLYKDVYQKQYHQMKNFEGAKFSDTFKKSYETWANLMKDSYTQLGASLQEDWSLSNKEVPTLSNFIKAYEEMNTYWKSLLENGVIKGFFTKEDLKRFMPENALIKIVDSLVGLYSIENLKKGIETYDNFHNTYVSKMQDIQSQMGGGTNSLMTKMDSMYLGTPYEPMFKMYSDLKNKMLDQNVAFGNVDMTDQNQKMTASYLENRKLYLDYAQKVNDFQQKIYAKAKNSLSETTELFWSNYQLKGVTPSYDDFVAQWIKLTQNQLAELLKSSEIETLQKEMKMTHSKVTEAIDVMMKEYVAAFENKKAQQNTAEKEAPVSKKAPKQA